MRYESNLDIPEHLLKYCSSIEGNVWFEHPLFRQMIPFECEPDLEAELFHLDEQLAEACGEGRWSEALNLIATDCFAAKYVLRHFEPDIPRTREGDQQYWRLVLDCARNRTEHYRQGQHFPRLFESPRSMRCRVLCGDDFGDFRNLKGPIDAWRGVVANSEDEAKEMIRGGFSWTLHRKKAEWFAKRTIYRKGSSFLAHARIQKSSMIAYLPSMGEGEILVWPNTVECWEFVFFDHL